MDIGCSTFEVITRWSWYYTNHKIKYFDVTNYSCQWKTFPRRAKNTHEIFVFFFTSFEWMNCSNTTNYHNDVFSVQCIYLFTSLEKKLRKSMNVNKTIGKRAKSFSAFILNACLEYSCVTTCQKLDYGLRIPMNIDISLNSKLTNWLHRFLKVNLIDSSLSVLYRMPPDRNSIKTISILNSFNENNLILKFYFEQIVNTKRYLQPGINSRPLRFAHAKYVINANHVDAPTTNK